MARRGSIDGTKLVGECYVHGVMKGEILELPCIPTEEGFPNITGYDCASEHAIAAPSGGVEQHASDRNRRTRKLPGLQLTPKSPKSVRFTMSTKIFTLAILPPGIAYICLYGSIP